MKHPHASPFGKLRVRRLSVRIRFYIAAGFCSIASQPAQSEGSEWVGQIAETLGDVAQRLGHAHDVGDAPVATA